jgi:thioredoxin-dependent peroxiredoxin
MSTQSITFQGNPLTLVGTQLNVGDNLNNFTATTPELEAFELSNCTSKVKIISVAPSIDTPVCEIQVNTLNKTASELDNNIEVITVTADLPFAQARFNNANSIKDVKLVSDYKDGNFASTTGTKIAELGILTRAIFVVDNTNTIQYVEYKSEITEELDYDAAIAKAKSLV